MINATVSQHASAVFINSKCFTTPSNDIDDYKHFSIPVGIELKISPRKFKDAKKIVLMKKFSDGQLARYNDDGELENADTWLTFCRGKLREVFGRVPSTIYFKEA